MAIQNEILILNGALVDSGEHNFILPMNHISQMHLHRKKGDETKM